MFYIVLHQTSYVLKKQYHLDQSRHLAGHGNDVRVFDELSGLDNRVYDCTRRPETGDFLGA